MKSFDELVQDIQDSTNSSGSAAMELLARLYRRLIGYADSLLFSKARSTVSASDVVLMGMKSVLSDIMHERITDPRISWEALIFAYIRKKAFAVNRAAGVREAVKSLDPASLERVPDTLPPSSEDVEKAFREMGELLPKGDRCAHVFEQVVMKGLSHDEAAKALGVTTRTISNKLKTIGNHFVDLLLSETKLDPTVQEAIRLVLDPRTQVKALPQAPGQRKSEFDRKILAAAKAAAVEPEEMLRRVDMALNALAGILNDAIS